MPRTATLALVVLVGSLTLAPGGSVVAMADAPGAALDDLLSRVPVSHRDDCRADLPDDLEEALMSVSCELSTGITVIYSQLPSADAVATRYDDRRMLEAIEWDSGDCASQLRGEQAYTVAGEPVSRRAGCSARSMRASRHTRRRSTTPGSSRTAATAWRQLPASRATPSVVSRSGGCSARSPSIPSGSSGPTSRPPSAARSRQT